MNVVVRRNALSLVIIFRPFVVNSPAVAFHRRIVIDSSGIVLTQGVPVMTSYLAKGVTDRIRQVHALVIQPLQFDYRIVTATLSDLIGFRWWP